MSPSSAPQSTPVMHRLQSRPRAGAALRLASRAWAGLCSSKKPAAQTHSSGEVVFLPSVVAPDPHSMHADTLLVPVSPFQVPFGQGFRTPTTQKKPGSHGKQSRTLPSSAEGPYVPDGQLTCGVARARGGRRHQGGQGKRREAPRSAFEVEWATDGSARVWGKRSARWRVGRVGFTRSACYRGAQRK